MSYDYYAEARRVADMLRNERLDDWALQISSAMQEGVTATEILMMLRWKLQTFLSAQLGSEEVIAQARELHHRIDIALS